MAGQRETPQDRQRRDEALAASAEAAEQEDRDAAAEAAEQLAAISAAATTPSDRAFVASASRIMLNDRRALAGLRRSRQAWQSEAWDYIAEIGECGFTVQFAANLISKIRLFPATRPNPKDDPIPVDDEESGVDGKVADIAIATLERLRSRQGGQAAMLRALDWNLEVAGELYLHGHEDEEAGEEWFVRSIDELVVEGDRFVLRTAMSSQATQDVGKDDLVIRLWDPDPRFSGLATSPMRRVLAVCENLLLLTRAMRADAMSHLNNGFVVKAQELSPGPKDPTQQEGDGETDDPFEVNFRETIISPIEMPGSAASVAPGIITGPAEYIKPDVLRHLTFSRPMDSLLAQWIDNLVMRLARGLNMPVEVTTGLQETTFCVDAETEILTVNGWRQHDALGEGDLVLTLNHETGMSEWQPVEAVNRFDVSDEPMLLIDGKAHSSLSTANHRWPAFRYRQGGWQHEPTRDTPLRRWLDSKPRGALSAVAAAMEVDSSYIAAVASGRIRPSRKRAETLGCLIGVAPQELLDVDTTTTRGQRIEPSLERTWVRTDGLDESVRLVTAAPCADLPSDPKWSDDLVELVAWFYTEGSVDRRGWRDGGGQATITQSAAVNPEKTARIRGALQRLVGPPVENLRGSARTGARLWVERRDRNRPMARFVLSKALTADLETLAPDRVPTLEFVRSLTRGQLEIFMEVSRAADGWTVNSGTPMFSQTDPRRVDGYQMACILSGRTPSQWSVTVATGPYVGKVQHYCSVTDRSTVMATPDAARLHRPGSPRVEWLAYTGTVWCPTTANATWLARRNGHVYFTGNTNAAVVKKSEWDAHGEPRAVLICEALTAGYFRDAMIEASVDPVTAAEVFVWYDPSDAIAAPDPTESVDKGSEEGLLRDETWRRVRGFSEADAPSPDEMLIRLAYHATRMDPFIAAQLLKVSGLFPDIQIPAPAGGILGDDGTVQGGPPPNGPATAADVTAAVMRALSAAGVVKGGSAGARLGRRLAAIDRDLRAKLLVACEQAMRRFLERAGAKVRSKVVGRGRDDPAARIASGSPFREVCARLGREVVTAAGIGEADLLDGAFDELGDDFSAWVDLAQTQAHTAVAEAVGLNQSAADALAAAQEAARARAAEALRAAMTELAGRRLFDASAGAPAMGEQDSTTTIPAWVVRQAMAIAGGDQPEGGDGTPMRSAAGGPAGGVAAGPDVLGVTGGVEAYEWDYGSAPRIPFPPHEALDGTVFENFDDDVLINTEGFPDSPYYSPGDHPGCICDAIPSLILPGDSNDSGGGDDGE